MMNDVLYGGLTLRDDGVIYSVSFESDSGTSSWTVYALKEEE